MSRLEVVLREYQPRAIELTATAARDLTLAGGSRLSITIGDEPGIFVLKPTQWVGSIVTDEVAVLIRPKVSIENLFTLLDVGIPDSAWNDRTFDYAASPNLLAAVADLYVRVVDQALARGVRRDYRAESDRLPALRGRIDFVEQLRRPGSEVPIACRFDEYTADIAENRALRLASRTLLRVPGVAPVTRRGLMGTLARLEEVSDSYIAPDAVDRIVITRLNRHYVPALRLASVILRNLTLADRSGSVGATSFLLDMNDLFQRWVGARLRRHLRGVLDVDEEPRWHLDVGRHVAMRPDLTFRRAEDLAGVADVKYKVTDTGLGRHGDYYQLLAYATASGLPDGVLIYCQGDGDALPLEVITRGSGKRLLTYQIDMTGDREHLESSVAALADWLSARWAHHTSPVAVGAS